MFSNFNTYKTQKENVIDLWVSIFSAIFGLLALESIISIGYLLWLRSQMGSLGGFSEIKIPVVVSLFGTIGGVAAVTWSVKREKWQLIDVGVLVSKTTVKEYLWGALMALLMLTACVAPALITMAAKMSMASLDRMGLALWLVYGVGFIIQSFSEEYLVRGFIMKRLTQRYNIIVTLIVQALIFMGMHAGNPGMSFLPYINLFLIGVIFGQLVLLTDNLMLASGLHWLWNFAQGCIFGIKVSGLEGMPALFNCEMVGSPLLTGGDFGIEGAFSTTIIYIIVFGLLMPKTMRIIKNKTSIAKEEISEEESLNG